MDESSFIGLTSGLQKVMTNSKSAYIHSKEFILSTDAYKTCKIEIIPWQHTLGYNTMLIQKYSPYEPFIKQVILDIYAKGILNKIQQKWSIKEPHCEEAEINPISFQKVVTCFVLIFCGIVLSMITLMMEKSFQFIRQRQLFDSIPLISEEEKMQSEEIRKCFLRINQLRETFPDQPVDEMIKEIGTNNFLDEHLFTKL